jgi:hypothetical protein
MIRNIKCKQKVSMSSMIQIHLPDQTIPVKTVKVKTDVAKVVKILKSINAAQ